MTDDDFAREPLEKLVAEIVALVIEADSSFMVASVRKRNRMLVRYRAIGDEILSRGEAGASAMITLMSHGDTAVRGAAAARCLLRNVDRDHAINVLADICDLRAGNVSMNAADALMFAGEFDMETGPIRRPARA
ncbi:MAG: DUF2019 domain-containing protein [Rhodospirillaceae bacterium]|nr:DUF2019 domain-containing protein [Rhodospirillaceae bacterium]